MKQPAADLPQMPDLVVAIGNDASSRFYAAAKRLLDLALSATLLLLLLPVIGLLALLLRLAIGPPVLFRQWRPGLCERPFQLVKFRTMSVPVTGEEGPECDATRLTPVGKVLRAWSLDEIPTLWNVLRGDMSLVGPRPLLMRYLQRYTPRQRQRHRVRPGITGWAQINGRNALSWNDKFELDCWYVEHRSLGLDLKILVRTLLKVVHRDGISQQGHATMPEFEGGTSETHLKGVVQHG